MRNYLSKKREALLGDLAPEEDWENRLANFEEDDLQMNADLEIEQRNRFIREMVKKMPILLQTILRLYHWENFSYSEIAEILALPEGTVKSYLFRARKRLKEMLMQTNFLGDY
jgi:RNA polymerase sigma-70 factor (ECF subfamily)